MTYDTLQSLIGVVWGLFALVLVGSAVVMRKATSERLFGIVSRSLRASHSAKSLDDQLLVVRQAVEEMPSPLFGLGDQSVRLFHLQAWTFAMFFSHSITSYVFKILNETTHEHLIYGATSACAVLYIVIAGVYLVNDHMIVAMAQCVTLKGTTHAA